MNKESPVALVTGGSRGIGRSIVEHLSARGVEVIAPGRSQLDVSRIETFDAFVAKLEGQKLDYLVNNAGIGHNAPFAEVKEADLDALLAVHFKGPFFLTQKLLPLMRDGGAIVNITTGLTRYTYPGVTAYASVKGAVEVWTRQLARELGPRRIAVNAVAPGGIETDFGGGLMKNADVQRFVTDATPYGRVGRPDDIGALVALLLDPGTRWMTGQRLELTGGFAL